MSMTEGVNPKTKGKSRKKLYLITALVATAVPFAFAATTASFTLVVAEKDDFVSVEAGGTPPTWNVWGKFKGTIGAGEVFKITPGTDFTGDLDVMVMIANGDLLIKCYRVLALKVSIYEDTGSGAADTGSQIGTTELLTLSKGEVDIVLDFVGGEVSPYWVYIDSGFYITHPWGSYSPSGDEDPMLYVDVVQKG